MASGIPYKVVGSEFKEVQSSSLRLSYLVVVSSNYRSAVKNNSRIDNFEKHSARENACAVRYLLQNVRFLEKLAPNPQNVHKVLTLGKPFMSSDCDFEISFREETLFTKTWTYYGQSLLLL